MRKQIVLLFLMFFLMANMGADAYCASPSPAIELEYCEEQTDDRFSIKVLLTNNPGIWGACLNVSYDRSVLKLLSVDNGDLFTSEEWTKGNPNGDVYILSFRNSELNENITETNGCLATLHFEKKDTAQSKSCTVCVSHEPGNVINIDLEDVNFSTAEMLISLEVRDQSESNEITPTQATNFNSGSAPNQDTDMLSNSEESLDSSNTEEMIVSDNHFMPANNKAGSEIQNPSLYIIVALAITGMAILLYIKKKTKRK